MNQQFQMPDNETIKKDWKTRDAERRSTLDQLGYDVLDQPGGQPKIVKKSDSYADSLDIYGKELSIQGQELTNEGKKQDLLNPPMTDKEKMNDAKKSMTEDIMNFYKEGKQKESGATEKVLYPLLKQAYPELDDKELWDSIYNLRKGFESDGTGEAKKNEGTWSKILKWFN